MGLKRLICVSCGAEYDPGVRYTCPACDGILEVFHIGGYEPDCMPSSMINGLSEGNTPLLPTCPRTLIPGFDGQVWLKDETRNPSGSFKDRLIAAAMSQAIESGAAGVVCASSGNAGAATAAYAARLGMPAIIVAPQQTPAEKLIQISAYGARLVKVEGHYSNSYDLGLRIARQAGYVNLTTTFLNPYGTDGLRRVGHELFRQLGNQVPDWVIIPTGSGPLVKGVLQGFQDMKQGIPRLVAVQAEGCAPIVRAFEAQAKTVSAWSNPTTFASGISDPLIGYEKDGTYTLFLVRSSGGIAISVSDDDIRLAMKKLASRAGVLAEPTGAASLAAAEKMFHSGLISPNDSIICMITGHGFKDLQAYAGLPVNQIEVAAGTQVDHVLAAFAGQSEGSQRE